MKASTIKPQFFMSVLKLDVKGAFDYDDPSETPENHSASFNASTIFLLFCVVTIIYI